MPLDGYSYLTSYGWTGKGNGLRKGAIEKPITVRQKLNFAGVGKDRDEAFPFWDHLFAAASKAITIKVASDDEDNGDTPFLQEIQRTSTGIISNRRPNAGTPASRLPSGAATPVPDVGSRLSLIAVAKREAARRGLYAKFFRGPVLGSDGPDTFPKSNGMPIPSSLPSTPVPDETPGVVLEKQRKRKKTRARADTKDERRERKRLKAKSRDATKKIVEVGVLVKDQAKDEAKTMKKEDQDTEEPCLSPPSKKRKRKK